MTILGIWLLPINFICGFLAAIIIYYQIKEHLYNDKQRNVIWWIYNIIVVPILIMGGYISLFIALWSKISSWMR